MNFVARAKALLSKPAKTAALALLPLASAVAVSFPSLPITNPGCTVTANECAAIVTQTTNPGNGLVGMKFATDGDVFVFLSGGGVGQLFMQTSGIVSPAFSGAVPLHYDFTLTGPTTSWLLALFIGQGGLDQNLVFVNGTGSGQFVGDTVLPDVVLDGGATPVTVNFLLNVNSTDSFTVNVPNNSIQFNAATSVPEASTATALLLGIGALGSWRVIRRPRRKA